MDNVTIWHNPRCSKSRLALSNLEQKKINLTVREYLKESPTIEEIQNILRLLGAQVRDIIRVKENLYQELALDNTNLSDAELIESISSNPKLLERPIVLKGDRAVIARPPEKLEELF